MGRTFVPGSIPKDIPTWQYNAFRRLFEGQASASTAVAAIVRGEVPDGSGTSLSPDLSLYFLLTGRPANQLAYGGTAASGTLTLSSTSNSTKGKIFFGSAQTQAAFDESTGFFGLGNVAPDSLLHITSTGTFIHFDGVTFTQACTGVSGDKVLQSTGTGFVPSGGPSITVGMAVSGTNIPANTFVEHIHTNTTISLTQALTGTVNGTVTFTPSSTITKVSDETGTDTNFSVQGAMRFTGGVAASPLRMLSDLVNSTQTGWVTTAACSAANNTRTVTSAALFGNVAVGDLITGGTIPTGTYVTAKGSSSSITVSNLLSTQTNIACTFRSQLNVALFESGTISSGNAVGASMQFGGPNRGEMVQFRVFSANVWFARNPVLGSNAVTVGVNANPTEFSSPNQFIVKGRGDFFGTAGGGTAVVLSISANSTGTVPSLTLSGTLFSFSQDGKFRLEDGSGGVYMTGGNTDTFQLLQKSNDLNLLRMIRVAAWSDSLAIANSFGLNLGDLNSTHRALFISSNGHGVLTRFGVSSKYTLLTNGQAGGNTDFPAPENTTSPTVVLVNNSVNNGNNACVVLKVQTLRSGQAGDMLQVLSSTPKVTASIDAAGVFTGVTANVFFEDDAVSFEDENVYYSTLNP